MNTYEAIGKIEGFVECKDESEVLEAWQFLVDNGIVWKLQGTFGRTALNLIASGFINPPKGYEFSNDTGKLAPIGE